MDDILTDAIERLFMQEAPLLAVRAIEHGESSTDLWEQITQSGFADALVSEENGGSGLCLSDIFGVLFACGKHAIPVPLGMTMIVRAAIAAGGHDYPDGPISIAPTTQILSDGKVRCPRVPFGKCSDWVVVKSQSGWRLLPMLGADTTPSLLGSLEVDVEWPSVPHDAPVLPDDVDWQSCGSFAVAAAASGAMERVLAMTIEHANQRVQFAKPIGKQQAIQQQISVMAEQVYAARMAAQMGGKSTGFAPQRLLAALAKTRTCEAAIPVSTIAHAVFGAMGVTDECDLQIYTRRIHEWRSSFGSESYWSGEIGKAFISSDANSGLEFIRRNFDSATA